MCGIAGYIDSKNGIQNTDAIQRMTNAIAHRGPDDMGIWTEHNVAIGHRRLSIIDLSAAGHQPMISHDARYIISYNGEVYNFQEIRSELQTKGFHFHSKTDTEVVLVAYEAWGSKAVEKFNGMFAFAIWDRKQQSLFLARDRYGIKPLYYFQSDNLFAFGSEQKAILQHPDIKPTLDRAALLEYFTFQNIFSNHTLVQNISLFPAGHYAEVSFNHQKPKMQIQQYWDFCFEDPRQPASEQEYSEELCRLFSQAVNRQLVTDVEIGSYLSGGMDSGSITAVAARSIPNMKSFTCGFDLSSASGMELAFDERRNAESMSYAFKTEHYQMVLKAGDMERCLPNLAYHLEEPRVGQSYPIYYAAQLASKFNKVVLSGAGGDELFAGYPWRYYRAMVNTSFDDYIDKYYLFWQRLVPNQQIKKLFSPVWNDVNHVWTRDIFSQVFKHSPEQIYTPEEYINHSLYFEAKTFLQGLLVVEDKLSMAHGLETRLPFLDNDLVDFAMRCPIRFKLKNLGEVIRLNENEQTQKPQNYFEKTQDGKLILRNAMKTFVPEQILNAKKQGFSAPDASWFKGESIDFVRKRLFDDNNKLYQVIDRDTTLNLVTEHLEGIQNRRLLIWSLINVSELLEKHLEI